MFIFVFKVNLDWEIVGLFGCMWPRVWGLFLEFCCFGFGYKWHAGSAQKCVWVG